MERTMKRRAAAAAAALALVTGGATLAGCGSDSSSSAGGAASTAAATATTVAASNGVEKLSAQEILDKSLAAANAASSVAVKGSITQGSQAITLDMTVGKDAAQGSIEAQGVQVQVRAVGGKAYFKMSGEALAKIAGQGDSPEVAKAISSLLGDKWLAVPGDAGGGQLDGLNQLAQKDSLIKGILEPSGEVSVKGTGEVNGTPVVFLESTDGSGTLAIQTVGEPYPVQIKGGDKDGSGQIDFTDWNAPLDVTAPTDVLDISALTKLGDSGGSSTSSG